MCLSAIILSFALLASPAIARKATPPPASRSTVQYFATESAAQAHCLRDIVVWLNIPTGIYHLKNQRWYGRDLRAEIFVG
jgi:hypothetical protein